MNSIKMKRVMAKCHERFRKLMKVGSNIPSYIFCSDIQFDEYFDLAFKFVEIYQQKIINS